jgi:Holliday junction resolvase
MPNSRRIGYGFECRVRKHFQKLGYMVIRQGRSRFPDLVMIKPGETFFCECKVNKYLSMEEKAEAKKIIEFGIPFRVAYRKNRKLLFYEIKKEERKC